MSRNATKIILCALLCGVSTFGSTLFAHAEEQRVETSEIVESEEMAADSTSEILKEGDWQYNILEDGTAAVVRYGDYSYGDVIEELEIPFCLGGLTVTQIKSIEVWPKKIVVPRTIAYIDSSAVIFDFQECVEIEIEEGNTKYESTDGLLYTIDTKELIWCARNKTNLEVPEGTTALGNFSLYNCDELETINLPSTMIDVAEGGGMSYGTPYYCTYAFDDLPSLKSIAVHADNPKYVSVDGILYSKDMTTLIYSPYAIQDLVIPENVTLVYDFEHEMNSIVFPFSVSSITSRAVSVETIVMMNPRCSIENYGESRYHIGLIRGWDDSPAQSFAENHRIPFESMGKLDFNLRVRQDGTVSITEYLGDATEIIIPSEYHGKKVTCVGGIYGGFSDVTKVTLPEGIVEISQEAFRSSSIEEINFPKSLRIIGEEAFYRSNLTGSITIPSHVETIGDWAFVWCDDITEITIEEGVSNLGVGAFSSCDGVKNIQLPNSVTQIEDKLFLDCKSLERVVIPNTVTSVGFGAFAGCENLKELVLPESVKSIDNTAFSIGDYMDWWEVGDGWLTLTIHNPECEIYDSEYALYYVKKIIGHEESTAQQYAEEYDVAFVDMDNPFADVKKSSWQYNFTDYAVKNSLMAGTGINEDGKIIFKPNQSLTREQFVQVLYNHSGTPEVHIENKFPDVDETKYYINAVLWTNENDIASGYNTGEFGVGDNISRQDLAVMLYKYAKLKGYDLTTTQGVLVEYMDDGTVSGYAVEALSWAVSQGIITGKGPAGAPVSELRLAPADTATRAECATMMMKLVTKNSIDG